MIKFGDKNTNVLLTQQLLKHQGFNPGIIDGEFGNNTLKALLDFQARHIGPDGKYLETDGVIGSATMWALRNPSGQVQRNNLGIPIIPKGLTPKRTKVIEVWIKEYLANVHEIPDGSNKGDGVDKYLSGWPAQWCCAFISWSYKEASGIYPFGVKEFSTWNAWQFSKSHNMFRDVKIYKPIPGDFMLIQHSQNGKWLRTGHIAGVIGVDDFGFNTLGGNERNAVKFGYRTYKQKELVGFINPYGLDEQPINFERRIITKENLGSIQTT